MYFSAFADGQIKCPSCRQDADPTSEFITLDQVTLYPYVPVKRASLFWTLRRH
jgi:hypothetical protein